MSKRSKKWLLFLLSGISLSFGFAIRELWIIGGLIGLIPAINWVIQDFRRQTFGSDILAVFALIGAIATDQLFAAAVVSFMLASGRILESWAEGQAERQLKSLIERVPRITHLVKPSGDIEEILIEDVKIGDRVLIRSGEIVPTDGQLLINATLDESALTGEPLPINRGVSDSINSGIVNAGAPFEYLATSGSEASVIIKGGATLELLGRTEVVLLDKTGTLTHGGPVVGKIQSADGYSEDEVLALAASVDQYSTHVVARALVTAAQSRDLIVYKIDEIKEIAGHQIQGKYQGEVITVGQLTQKAPSWLTMDYPLIVAIQKGELLIGAIGSTGSVVVVGDGINDAPALSAADVGVAMGARGATAASEAADVVIVEDSIDRLTMAIKIAKRSRDKALQAAGVGMGLSFIMMSFGGAGLITPGEGAIAQEIIDVIAILWALTSLLSDKESKGAS